MQKARMIAVMTVNIAIGSAVSLADPLHKHGHEGAWVHPDSGWIFPMQVGEFTRVDSPYTIDGNNDVGVQYEHAADGTTLRATVEVFSTQSVSEHSAIDSARAAMQSHSGPLRQQLPFTVDGAQTIEGNRYDFEAQATLYFLRTGEWVVNIRANTGSSTDLNTLDAFVRALPWDKLGSDVGLH